jgi:hypothetical protein
MVTAALTLFIEEANQKDPLKREMTRQRIAAIMYGHLQKDEPQENDLKYNHQRRDGAHVWSGKNVGYNYGFREYSKFIGFKDYIEVGVDLIDDLLEGYGRGTEDFLIAKAKAEKDAANRNKGKMDKEEQAAMNLITKGK